MQYMRFFLYWVTSLGGLVHLPPHGIPEQKFSEIPDGDPDPKQNKRFVSVLYLGDANYNLAAIPFNVNMTMYSWNGISINAKPSIYNHQTRREINTKK